jgi:ankyrin repeat protein
VRALLQGGAYPNFRGVDGVSPLGIAVARGHREVVHALLAADVDPNGPAVKDQPALLVAVAHHQTTLAVDLIEAGAALEYCDPSVGSALMLAIAKGDRRSANELARAGVPSALRNEGGARPLHIAAFVGDEETARMLLAHGADVHEPTMQGGTPLRAAAAKGHAEVVRLLLDAGADPAPIDAFDKRPLDYAKEGGHERVVQLLASAKRTPSVRRERADESPLSLMLPPRRDATLKAAIEARQQQLTITRAASSSLEAPSAIAAVRSFAGPSFHVQFPVEDEPDPRLPVRPVDLVLWTYERSGKLTIEAAPAVPKPPASVIELAASVAEVPYLLSTWSRAAAKAARRLPQERLREAMAVMVHPPPGPAYLEPWVWTFRVQVAAALVASFVGDEPWAESPRRSALEAVLDGPADWTNTAAVIALLDVGRRDEVARPAVADALVRTARRPMNPAVYQHAIRPAARALLELPDVSPDVVQEMRKTAARDQD